MQSLDEVRTARMLLTRMRESDLPDLCRFHRDERVMATLGGVRSDEETERRLQVHVEHWDRHGFGWWMARGLSTGEFIGRGGLRHLVVENEPRVEVGYGLMAEFWGRGLATELAAESLRVGFEVLGFPELVTFTLPTNLGSRRVMKKVGFTYDHDGVWADLLHVFYRLTAEQWRRIGACPCPCP
jgi:[ribosomal protein S5]-alanine N-acetyltransferase